MFESTKLEINGEEKYEVYVYDDFIDEIYNPIMFENREKDKIFKAKV